MAQSLLRAAALLLSLARLRGTSQTKNVQPHPSAEVFLPMPTKYARCYAPGAPMRSHDHCPIRVEDARQMVADGLAEIVNHGKDIRMFARTVIRLRDRSCSWSHRLMELVAEGNHAAVQMLRWMEGRAA